jgi:hypothetical protein
MEGQKTLVRCFLKGKISEFPIKSFQLYVKMQLHQLDCHGKCM